MLKLHVYKTEREVSAAFAEWFAELVKLTLEEKDIFTVALSGGDTPKMFYKILAADYADKIDWSRIHVFWGDEKTAFLNNDKSNAAATRKALLDHVPVSENQLHIIPAHLPPEQAAKEYETLLHKYFKTEDSTFDLAILGMGKDGNTLSLFPGNEENNEKTVWVIPVFNKEEDFYRITLTSPVINASAVTAFLITGKSKQDAVQHALKGKYDPEKYPAQLMQKAGKTVHWFLDEAAAGKLMKLTP